MSHLKLSMFLAPAVMLLAAGSSEGAAVGDPGSLHPGSVVIDFEGFPVGTSEPIVVGGVTISTFNREGNSNPRQVVAPLPHQTQHADIFEGNYFAPGRHDFRIEFATPVSQVGLGVHDPNYVGNVVLAYDALGNVIDFAASQPGDPVFPTGPSGGSHSTFVGFVRPSADIVRLELHNAFDPTEGRTDLLAIDNVMFFANGGTGVIPEPGSVALLGIGCVVAGLGWVRKTRRARRA